MLLALMPQSHHHLLHTTTPMAATTMSLAILPSAPTIYSPLAGPALRPTNASSPSKRPKLSLNTADAPSAVFGKGSTSLRLDTLSATSPTTKNTFRNAYSQFALQRKTQLRSPRSPRLGRSDRVADMEFVQSPSRVSALEPSTPVASSSPAIASLPATDAHSTPQIYELSSGVDSILTNGPHSRFATQKRVSTASSGSLSPTTKSVAFRTPLTEEIQTSKYTLKHSDIESSVSTISTQEPSSTAADVTGVSSDQIDDVEDDHIDQAPAQGSPRLGDKRESSDEEDDSDTCPATPVAGRNKRHRQWVWTLGPVDNTTRALKLEEQTCSIRTSDETLE